MLDLTFLTVEQIFGDNALDVIKKYGTKCAITDFAILLGGYVSEDEYIDEGNTLKNRTGCWWTKSANVIDNNDVQIVNDYGDSYLFYVSDYHIGCRPALPYSSIELISYMRGISRIKEIEYGEYPQTIVDEKYSCELERAYNDRRLRTTGKNYTTDSVESQNNNTSFKARTHIEYEYNEKKYIRFVGDSNRIGYVLSDGRVIKSIKAGQVYWVLVEPIVWLVDEKADIALSKYILFSGVQFKNERNYDGDFNKAFIKQFMDNYFSKEILINQKYLKNNQFLEENNENLDDIFEEATLRMNQINGKVKTKTL